jgi:SAM-dependent methyltransferase
MTRPPSPDTPQSWGAASRGYAENVAPVMMETFAGEFVERLQVTADHEALEIAAGSGALTATLARHVKSLLATDFAPKMIEVLRERMDAAGASNVSYAIMDGQKLELDNARFDRAASSFGMMLFPDRARGFAELHRVLRPGGRAVISAWAGPEKLEAFALFLGALKAAFPDMPAPPTPPPIFSLADPAKFKSELELAGFGDVQVDYVARELEVADFPTLWTMMSTGAPPVEMIFDRVGDDGKARVRDALAEIVEKRWGSDPIRVTNVATVASAAVPE